jgi:hypothetical protein
VARGYRIAAIGKKLCQLLLATSRWPLATSLGARGVTYLVVMFSIILMGATLTAVGKQWKVILQRDHEAELRFRGERIKLAIQSYAADYEVRKAARPNRYPLTLEQLTQKPKRYLPVVYKDPITRQEFALIKVGGEIRGVKSRSKDAPLDQVHFKNATAYDQIRFEVAAGSSGCIPSPNPINPLLTNPCAVPTEPMPALPPNALPAGSPGP